MKVAGLRPKGSTARQLNSSIAAFCRGAGGRGLLWRPFSFFCGWVSRARPAPTAGAGSLGRSGPCPRCCCLQNSPSRGGRLAPPGGRFGAGWVSGEEQQPFGAEPGGGVRNREQGASCLSAASSCPAGSAPRRPGSSQRQGCPFAVVWRRPHDGFFSLGRQRKERRPARGRCHLSDAGASGQRSHAGAWERSYDHGPRQAQ